jgi:hypothetical protein
MPNTSAHDPNDRHHSEDPQQSQSNSPHFLRRRVPHVDNYQLLVDHKSGMARFEPRRGTAAKISDESRAMSEPMESDRLIMLKPSVKILLNKARWPLWALLSGLIVGTWIGGGPNRYGEEDGVVGGLRGAGRTMNKGFCYTAASLRDCITFDRTAVRKLGLSQQIETRLWQDKRLVADEIIVQVEDGGTAILRGIVPDEDHKDRAVTLARDTRGVEKVVDELAVRPSSRIIKAAPGSAVPTGVASSGRDIR